MKNILISTISLCLLSLPALAGERRVCGNIEGFPVCALDTEHMDTLQIDWNDGDQTSITVHCESLNWHRTGWALDETNINKIVNHWCN